MSPRQYSQFSFFLFASSWVFAAHAEEVDFNRDIKPILSENCYFCHGPDGGDRKADLRLDTYEGATAEVVVPGKADESELIARILSDDPDDRMPPPKAKISLDDREKELLKKWVDSGAEYEEHWAFVAPVKAKLAADEHPIDQLVGRSLAKDGLDFAPQASADILIRRVFLDLTGLPPTPQQVAQFVADDQPGAYGRMVDRLLASPAYGERMAWDWLDASRYADSNGYQGDNERTMWPWRDWVVEAFNKNLPYDQFSVWQLAGDLLPDANEETILATGFCRNHPINGEGGRIAEENRVDYVMDMTETMGTVWLGLTLNCCRCHDHKFDPLAQKDYYQLSDYFNHTPVDGGGRNAQTPPVLAILSADQKKEAARLDGEIAKIGLELKAQEKVVADRKKAGVQSDNLWNTLRPEKASALKQKLTVEASGEILTGGENPDNDTYTVQAKSPSKQVRALRLDVLKHKSMVAGGLSRAESSNFVLTEIEVSLRKASGGDAQRIKIARAEATFEQGDLKIANAFDGKKETGWAVYEGRPVDREHAAVFHFEKAIPIGEGDRLEVVMRHDTEHKHHNIGFFRLAVSGDESAALGDPEQAKLAKIRGRNDQLKKQRENASRGAPKVMVMEDRGNRRETFILDTGLYNKKGAKVGPGVPASLPPMPDGYPQTRLGLAKWLVAAENPLTARVTVNRFWQQLFGIGLVKTAEDFGTQGETPPNQELLDWLAVDFRDNGWDVKRLMRQIVTSKAYRQTPKSAEGYREDPENRRLARGPRFRMPSWMLRDQALAASGLMVDRVGGPPVNPYQPPGVWEETSFGKKKYQRGKGDDLYRRSLYTFWRRIAPPTAFFDSAGRQVCEVKPLRTNTPLHALYTFNDVTFVEAARVLAEKAMHAHPDDEAARFNFIYYRVLARRPSVSDVVTLSKHLESSRQRFAKDPGSGQAFVSVGESPRDEKLDLAEHAAWSALCLAVFNLDEAITKP